METYYKPSSYSIDYPTVNGTANITDSETNIILISIPDFYMTVTDFRNSILDPQEQAVKYNIEAVGSGKSTVSDVQPIVADGYIGYGYFTMDPNTAISKSEMFFETWDSYYHITIAGLYTTKQV